jgi:hypothetical protein
MCAGKYVDIKDTISGFKGVMEGKYDDLPEMAFYMVSSWGTLPLLLGAASLSHLRLGHPAGQRISLCVSCTTMLLLMLDATCARRELAATASTADAQVGDIKEVQEKADKMVRWAMCSPASPCTITTASITMHS